MKGKEDAVKTAERLELCCRKDSPAKPSVELWSRG
jgi:hypothetical protein